jgi:hypothetical protein
VSEHDDELADFGGEADVAVVAVTVAMHVASIALLHRSAKSGRDEAAHAAAIVRARLRRRGAIDLAELLDHAPGTPACASAIAAAAEKASERIAHVPRAQLVRAIGRGATTEVLGLRAKACLTGGSLRREDLAALLGHLENGGELAVGIGRGSVFLRAPSPPHKQVEVELAHLPDPTKPRRSNVRSVRRRGAAAREVDVPATLVIIVHAGGQEVRVVRDGRDRGGTLVFDRFTIEIGDAKLEVTPTAPDPARVLQMKQAKDWAFVHAQVRADPILRTLVDDLYTKPGFGGSVEVLAALVDLAPLIHAHVDVARGFVDRLPREIDDPITQIIGPLRAALEAHSA